MFDDYFFYDEIDFSRYTRQTAFVFNDRVAGSTTFRFDEASYVEIHNGQSGDAPVIIARLIDHLRVVYDDNNQYCNVRIGGITRIKHLEFINDADNDIGVYKNGIRAWMDDPSIERLTISCLHKIPSVDTFRHAFNQRPIAKPITFKVRDDYGNAETFDELVKICRDHTDIIEFHESENNEITVIHDRSDDGMPIIRVVTTSLLFNSFRRSFGTHIKTKTNRDAPWVRLRTILLNAPMSTRYIVVDDKPLITNFAFDNVVPGQLSIRLGPKFEIRHFDRLTRIELPMPPIKFVQLFDRSQLSRNENNQMLVASIDLTMSFAGIREFLDSRPHRVFDAPSIVEGLSKSFGNYNDEDAINPEWVMEEEDDDYI
jgi:hypothetical protein